MKTLTFFQSYHTYLKKTMGTPLCITIGNVNEISSDKARERALEESTGSLVWLGGAPFLCKLGNKIANFATVIAGKVNVWHYQHKLSSNHVTRIDY